MRTRVIDGALWIRENGQWRPASPLEETSAGASPMEAFGAGLSSIPGQFQQMAHSALSFAAPAASPVSAYERGVQSYQPTQGQVAADRLSAFQPGMVMLGQNAPDLAGMAFGIPPALALARQGGRAAAGAIGRTVSRSVVPGGGSGRAQRVSQQISQRATELGGDSAGAAAADAPTGRLNDVAARIMDEMTAGGEMTADQVRLLDVGKRLGFEELPGMRGRGDSAGRQWMAAYMSNPSVRFAIQETLDANATLIETKALKAIGLEQGRWGTESFRKARQAVGQEFDAVRDSLPQSVTLPENIREGLAKAKGIAPELEEVVDEAGSISRDNLFALRSDLNLLATDLASSPGNLLKANRVGDVSESLDDFIRSQLPEGMAGRWQSAREKYLISKLLEKPGVMQPDGSLSWRSARTVLNREMPSAFRQTLEGARGNLSPATREFMDAVDYASAFGDLVPNSGTATRQSIGKMGPISWAQGQAMRYYLRRERDRLNPGGSDGQ